MWLILVPREALLDLLPRPDKAQAERNDPLRLPGISPLPDPFRTMD